MLRSQYLLSSLISVTHVLSPIAVLALPVTDNTVGTQVIPVTPESVQIDGGTLEGQNLFHSFSSFNIDTEESVYFISPAAINHIFSRVTGGSESFIDGTLGTSGSDAALYLINPNGVAFGPNASLDVQGSFIVTTADAIEFGQEGVFSAVNPGSDQLLAINPSAFFFSELSQPADIIHQANFQVPAGESLVLLGGDINLDGGQLITPGGRIEIGAITGPGTVNVSAGDTALTVSNDLERGNVQLSNEALIDVAASGGGDISVYANNVDISESRVIAGIDINSNNPDTQGGGIVIDATGNITLSDSSFIENEIVGTGQAGDIIILANALTVDGVSQISTSNRGSGSSGDIVIDVQDSVIFTGASEDLEERSSATSGVERGATGDSGDIQIFADTLEITAGAGLGASNLGRGDAGNIVLTIQDQVMLDGASSNGELPSVILSGLGPEATGNGGSIEIYTGSLIVTDGATLNASTLGDGDAGDITIYAEDEVVFDGVSSDNESLRSGAISRVGIDGATGIQAKGNGGDVTIFTNNLTITNGALVTASTFGQGDAGNVSVHAQGTVIVTGAGDNPLSNSGIFSRGAQGVTGNGGNIEIYASNLEVLDGGRISANTRSSDNAGNIIIELDNQLRLNDGGIAVDGLSSRELESSAGNLEITANQVLLENGSFLRATSSTSDGGNIILTIDSLLTLRDGSRISATAGSLQTGGDGGNITITVPFIVAIPTEDSDITANAFEGEGGQVTIIAA
nr:filamentous hemagglutinin N-terminal domain-containing protein [Leptolyngbyaceae cyanobacterium MAG.088]